RRERHVARQRQAHGENGIGRAAVSLRDRHIIDRQTGADYRQDYVIASCAAGVADLQDLSTEVEDGSRGETSKSAADRIRSIVVDNRERIAERRREAERGAERAAAEVHGTVDGKL